MIFLSYNAQQSITLPIRNWDAGNDLLTGYGSTWRLRLVLTDKDTRVVTNYTITSPSFDADTRELTFTYNSTALKKEVTYIAKIQEQEYTTSWVDTKALAVDKIYVLPSGDTISTYQPVLDTTEKTMNNDFVIYGE